ncbi:ATPase domain-containing protein, partial [Pyrobaculum sp.]|uniref:ATPase domain-containing protein n=1 Tax=Pyrobaculum sp. TaxID=2004705 RepID=UPI003D1070E2
MGSLLQFQITNTPFFYVPECDWVFKIASRSSETARRLKELCEQQGLSLQHVAMMTPMELMELLDVDAITTAENIVRRAREIAGFDFVRRYQPGATAAVLKTGVAEFDEKTPWGGLKFGSIYGFAGEYGTGKSILAMQAAARAACENRYIAYIDTENAYNHSMMERLLKRFCGGEWERAAERVEVFQVP